MLIGFVCSCDELMQINPVYIIVESSTAPGLLETLPEIHAV
jgi:hypothetical protein